ncbi:glycoside hydrolase family 88 protein, partial [Verrucomicrobiales bacterium]|nr:glycoside hydrolase family 88 protein [Verrucomicrobiales bacterium]
MRFFTFLFCLGLSIARADEPFKFPVGLDSEFKAFSATLASREALDPNRWKPSILVISETQPESLQNNKFLLSFVEFSNVATFPPEGNAYVSKEQYLWRWIQALGPDAVVTDNESLRTALKSLIPTYSSLADLPVKIEPSPVQLELKSRSARTPTEVAEALSKHYGNHLKSATYQPALAMIGRSRLAKLTGKNIDAELIEIAKAAPESTKMSASHYSGHLIFAELGMTDQTVSAARLAIKNPSDNQMSDSVFMVCPLLAAAGRLADDEAFYQACVIYLDQMQKLCLRPDGLYRHSPLDEAAWGRGNGFPVLGLAWVLSEMPESLAMRERVELDFVKHIEVLVKHQDASGMWHQVIDKPGSYREFTSTCMITFAITRGMEMGVLDSKIYGPIANRGWEAIKLRISLDGKSFTDGCTGTGKQKTEQ